MGPFFAASQGALAGSRTWSRARAQAQAFYYGMWKSLTSRWLAKHPSLSPFQSIHVHIMGMSLLGFLKFSLLSWMLYHNYLVKIFFTNNISPLHEVFAWFTRSLCVRSFLFLQLNIRGWVLCSEKRCSQRWGLSPRREGEQENTRQDTRPERNRAQMPSLDLLALWQLTGVAWELHWSFFQGDSYNDLITSHSALLLKVLSALSHWRSRFQHMNHWDKHPN